MKLIRQAQWRWDFGVASHGGAFHAPQEIQRISTKEKARPYIGWDIPAEKAAKDKFLKEIVPGWLEKAKSNGRIAKL